ncbi:exocyst complex component Sec6 [Neoconidiobolus thromboides FSU 785]|nr:exocyst complex component Sec6 [Neoconidiobolus thromboides FSU 785]
MDPNNKEEKQIKVPYAITITKDNSITGEDYIESPIQRQASIKKFNNTINLPSPTKFSSIQSNDDPLTRDMEAYKVAISRLSELLKHPDDLNVKIDFLRKKLIQEKSTVEIQLRTDVQSQFDDIQETFKLFSGSNERLNQIRQSIQKVEILCKENQSKIPGYETIKELSRIHSNMVATHRYVKRFQVFQQQINLIEQLLARARIPGGLTKINLLVIHYELYHVEEFRDVTMHYSKKCSQEVAIDLNQVFRKVDQVSSDFLRFLWDVVKDLYLWIENGELKHFVHVIKIVECEELADKRALQVEQAKTQSLKFAGQRANNKWKLAEGSPRKNKGFKNQFLNSLKEAIELRFQNYFQDVDQTNLFDVIATLESIPQDLKLLNDTLFSAFPPSYNIFDFFVNEYHKRVFHHLETLVSDISKLIGGEILEVMRFIQDYHDELFHQLGISQSSLEPPLLGGNQSKLIEGYLSIVMDRLSEQTSALIKLDLDYFLIRDKEPHINHEGNYYLSASDTGFEAYDAQIELAADANSARILVEVIKCCTKMAQVYQQRCSDTMRNELEKYLDDPSSISQGFVEYVIALINNQLRSVDRGEPLINKVSGMLHDVYKERAMTYINEMSDGFFKLATLGVDIILKVIFNDLKELYSQIYTEVWYEEDLILCIIATYEDYCEDFKTQLNPFLFNLLMEKLLELTMIESIKAFKNKQAKFILPQCSNKMLEETKGLQEFFNKYLDNKYTSVQFDPLIRLQNLASSPSKMIFLEFYPLRKQYFDMPLNLIEDIIQHRVDLDWSQRREVLESIRTKENELDYQDSMEPSIFSKIQFNNNLFTSKKFF